MDRGVLCSATTDAGDVGGPRVGASAEINAAIAARCGVGSEFEDENGFYVEAVGQWTLFTALPGWEERLVKVESQAGVVGWCLSALDLAVVKLDAACEKDLRYVQEMLRAGIVRREEIVDGLCEAAGLVCNDAQTLFFASGRLCTASKAPAARCG